MGMDIESKAVRGEIRWAEDSSKCLTFGTFGYFEIWECGARRKTQDFTVDTVKNQISFGRNFDECMSVASRLLLTSKVRSSRCDGSRNEDKTRFRLTFVPPPTEAPTPSGAHTSTPSVSPTLS